MAQPRQRGSPIGVWGVVALGIGGMVGGGIFAVLGLSVQVAGGGAPIAFLVAGLVALLTARSYALLSRSYPSRGGTVTFVNRAFGPGLFAGGINVLLWLSYIVMHALYAEAFGSYAASFLPEASRGLGKHVLLTGAVGHASDAAGLTRTGSAYTGRGWLRAWRTRCRSSSSRLSRYPSWPWVQPHRVCNTDLNAPAGLRCGSSA